MAGPEPPATLEAGVSCVTSGCHGGFLEAASVHPPVAGDECSTCHEQEGDRHRFSPTAESQELCAMCHEVTGGKEVHPPADDDCLGCHDPHSSRLARLLVSEPRELCGACHGDVLEEAEAMAAPHGALRLADGCVGCHSPHSSDNASLLRSAEPEICLGCHGRPMRGSRRPMPDLRALLDENANWHEPLRDGGCTTCHLPHASEHAGLLQAPYPAGLYAPFDAKDYGLCFSCHDEALASTERTASDTGFRDGETNLHFAHVHKAERGRTCRVCHETHASREKGLLREEVPYGSWRLPINHERTDSGGSCHPGCHGRLSYDRRVKDE